jgi:Protein of unknown function (DUF3352)
MSDHLPPDEPVQPPVFPPTPGPEISPEPEPTAEAPRRKRGAVIALVVAIVLVVACSGGALAYFKMRGAPSTVLDKLPAGATAAFVAHLDPAAGQKANLFRLTERFPDLGSREELGRRFDEIVDRSLGDAGLSHDDLGWIGGEAGGYVDVGVGAPEFAAVVATDDEAAAKDTLEGIQQEQGSGGSTTTISDVDVSIAADGSAAAVFDGVAVLASDQNAMRAVIDTSNGGSSVEDDAVFRGVMQRLPQDNLGFAFVNIHDVVSLLNSIPAGVMPNMPSTAQLDAVQGAGMAVTAQPDGLAIDTVVTTDPSKLTQQQRDALADGGKPNDLLALTPANAFAVVATSGGGSPALGGNSQQAIGDALDQIAQVDPSAARTIQRLHLQQLLSHLTGDVAVEVGPGSGSTLLPVGGTVMVGIDDPDAVSSWLDRYLPGLLRKAELASGTKIALTTQDHDGVEITSIPGTPPAEVSWAVLDKAIVFGVSPADVAAAIDLSHGNGNAIATDQGFASAVAEVPGSSNVLYVDVRGVLSAVRSIIPADAYQSFLDSGGRDVEPIDVIVAGGSTDENGSTARLLIRVP